MQQLSEMDEDLSRPEISLKLKQLRLQFGMIDGEVALYSHTTEQAQGSSAIHKAEFYSKLLQPSTSEPEVGKTLVRKLKAERVERESRLNELRLREQERRFKREEEMSEKMRQVMEDRRQEKQLKLEQSISRIKNRQLLANDSTSAYSRDHSV